MNNSVQSSQSNWRTVSPPYFQDDDNEVKPNILNLIPDLALPHSVHDFSIHIQNRKEYTAQDLLLSDNDTIYGSTSGFSHCSPLKCTDTYVATTCCGEKRWSAEDVSKVVSIERTFFRTSTLIIRFPDKKVNKQVVTKFHGAIRAVNFLQSPFARRCCVTLKDTANRNEVLTMLNSTRFGSGFLSADGNFEELIPAVDDIDPFTLFFDNVSPQYEKQDFIRMFPLSQQISIGYTNKIYYTKRYAFIIYGTVKEAIEAFKNVNKDYDEVVRFRRFSGTAHLPISEDIKKCQAAIECSQLMLPIVTDPGAPVLSSERNYKVLENVTIKTEIPANNIEIIIDDDDDIEDCEGVKNFGPNTDFDKLYENLKRSRLQMSLLRQMD